MKKILSAILAAVLLLSLMLPVFAEEEGLIYIYGGSSNKNRAKLKTMGQQSWYMMYSTEINKGAEIDIASFKECVQTETGMYALLQNAAHSVLTLNHDDIFSAVFFG